MSYLSFPTNWHLDPGQEPPLRDSLGWLLGHAVANSVALLAGAGLVEYEEGTEGDWKRLPACFEPDLHGRGQLPYRVPLSSGLGYVYCCCCLVDCYW